MPRWSSDQRWTDEDRKVVQELFPNAPRKVILDRFPNRTWTAVKIQARHMGLKRRLPLHERKEIDRVKALSEFQLGYVAGFFDGEGCVYMEKPKHLWYPAVNFTNSDLRVIEYIQEVLGKDGSTLTRHKHHNRWRISYQLRIRAHHTVKSLLEQITPYLIVKREVAEVAIRALELREEGKADSERMRQLAEEIRLLNLRGKARVEADNAKI